MNISDLKDLLLKKANYLFLISFLLSLVVVFLTYLSSINNENDIAVIFLIILVTSVTNYFFFLYFNEKQKIGQIISMISKRPKTLESFYLTKRISNKTSNHFRIILHIKGFNKRTIKLTKEQIDPCIKLLSKINKDIKKFS